MDIGMILDGLTLLGIAYWAYRAVGKKHPELQSISLKSIFKIKNLPFVPRVILLFISWIVFMCIANQFLLYAAQNNLFRP